jgi:hypothetical protein
MASVSEGITTIYNAAFGTISSAIGKMLIGWAQRSMVSAAICLSSKV